MTKKEVLDSWKEIAAYLGRSEKTCRRLEKELGLPVHRLEESPKARVYAYKDEIDSWKQKTQHSEKWPPTSKEIPVTFGLKKRVIPVLIFISVAIIGILIWQLLFEKEASHSPAEEPSIAILPFEDLSPDKDQEHLCVGFAESLLDALAKIKNLRVPARTSSFSFKGKERDIKEVGKKLNVRTILEGSLQKAGSRIRITTQLINVEDESLIWSEQYSRDLDDLFSIQDEIALAIINKLKINLLGLEEGKLVKRHTDNLEAYNLYLIGRLHWEKRTKEELFKAIGLFSLALNEDPNYALAYTGIADSYHALIASQFITSREGYPKAKEAVSKALKIDSVLPEAHASLAAIKFNYYWDWQGAEKEFKKAIELNPNYAVAHHWYAKSLMRMERHDEALKEIMLAKELDPLSPRIASNVGQIFFYARQYDRVIGVLKKSIKKFPDDLTGHMFLGLTYLEKSLFEEALAVFQNNNFYAEIAMTYTKMGKRNEAVQSLDDFINKSHQFVASPYMIANIYFGLGEDDKGFEWLDKAYQERDFLMSYLKVEPYLDIVREDPRFKAMMKKMNFE